MSKVIIGIHGLGNKPQKNLLEEWWKAAINEGFNLAGILTNMHHSVLWFHRQAIDHNRTLGVATNQAFALLQGKYLEFVLFERQR